MIDFNKLTHETQNSIMAAQEILGRYQNNQMTPEHMLLAMLEDKDGLTNKILTKLNRDISSIIAQTESVLAKYPKIAYQAS